VREDRPDHQADVVLDHGPVHHHVHGLPEPALGQLVGPVRLDRPERDQRLRPPPFVVAHREPVLVAEMPREVLVGHRRVRAERHQHGDVGRASGERVPDRAEQHRQRTAPGAVRHDHEHRLATEVGVREVLHDELPGHRFVQGAGRTADGRRTRSQIRHPPNLPRRFAACPRAWRRTG
jgi:hypothetical protein